MKPHFSAIVFSCLIANSAFVSAQVQAPPKVKESAIDFSRARSLLEKERGGQQLSQDEREYLNRAKAFRRNQQRHGQPGAAGPRQRIAPERLLPLTDMSAEDRYEGEDGGLYGGGRNTPPEALSKTAAAALAKIKPLDQAGKPAADGYIVFVSISMSNATQEFSRFKELADSSSLKSTSVRIVDCAQGGQAMAQWVPPDARPWKVAQQRLKAAGVTPAQVQVVTSRTRQETGRRYVESIA